MELVLLLLLSSLLLTTRAAADVPNAVLDADGDPLQSGRLYFAVSAEGNDGGLKLVSPKGSCPLNVAPEPRNELSGQPLAFFPEDSREATIREGDTLYIMFVAPTQCGESTQLKLDRSAGENYVTTGGTSSNRPAPHDSRFAIYHHAKDSSSHRYQIRACPCSMRGGNQRPECRMGCTGTLGLAEGQNEAERLIAVNTNQPLTVNFVKVSNSRALYPSFLIRSAAMRRPYSDN